MFDVKGKVAVVTGAATGIGRACALQLARAGCGVVVNYSRSEAEARQTTREVESFGVPAVSWRCDISVDKDVRVMMERIAEDLGRIDVLVCCAGATFFVPLRDLDGMSEDKWERILRVNVMGTFYCVRAAVPYMRQHKRGAIVLIGSRVALNGLGSSIAYAASKGALVTLTQSLARILGPEITVNLVSPGAVDTRWNADGLGAERWEEEKKKIAGASALGRISTAEDVADVVVSIITRGDMVTAQHIIVGADELGSSDSR
jgi:3-oxoacyl-[acyl-carrier protein] reductase